MKENIKSGKGITLVSLVVTIIILIILAGISINSLFGANGLITIAKRAKENMEFAQIEEQEKLNELYMQFEDEQGITGGEIDYDIIAKLNNFKKQIADYIEEAGGEKPDYTADAITFGERIKGIVAKVTEKTTAEEPQILQNYIAYSKGKLRTGTMVNQGAKTASLNAGESYTIPEGYHNGQGKITANSLASQTPATATAEDISSGKTAWVNGNFLTGTKTFSNYKNLIYGSGKQNNYNSQQLSFTVPKDATTGFLIVSMGAYMDGDGCSITIINSAGIKESIQVVNQYYLTDYVVVSPVTSIWNCVFNPGETITIKCYNSKYPHSTYTYMLIY